MEEARSTLAKAYEVAKSESLLDGLTGLGNHRSFQEELARHWEITRRHGVSMAVAIIDHGGPAQVRPRLPDRR